MKTYTETGIIDFPSYAMAEKGKAVLASLVQDFAAHLEALGEARAQGMKRHPLSVGREQGEQGLRRGPQLFIRERNQPPHG